MASTRNAQTIPARWKFKGQVRNEKFEMLRKTARGRLRSPNFVAFAGNKTYCHIVNVSEGYALNPFVLPQIPLYPFVLRQWKTSLIPRVPSQEDSCRTWTRLATHKR